MKTDLDKAIRKVPNFPKKGILFYDVTSIFTKCDVFEDVIEEMCNIYDTKDFDGIIAIDSRGFLLGAPLALRKKVPLVLARKKGKLPLDTIEESYALEYGEASLEIQTEDLTPGKRWLIIDDLIATGGTIKAVANMIERQNSSVAGVFGIIGLPFLKYSDKIGKYKVTTLISYSSE